MNIQVHRVKFYTFKQFIMLVIFSLLLLSNDIQADELTGIQIDKKEELCFFIEKQIVDGLNIFVNVVNFVPQKKTDIEFFKKLLQRIHEKDNVFISKVLDGIRGIKNNNDIYKELLNLLNSRIDYLKDRKSNFEKLTKPTINNIRSHPKEKLSTQHDLVREADNRYYQLINAVIKMLFDMAYKEHLPPEVGFLLQVSTSLHGYLTGKTNYPGHPDEGIILCPKHGDDPNKTIEFDCTKYYVLKEIKTEVVELKGYGQGKFITVCLPGPELPSIESLIGQQKIGSNEEDSEVELREIEEEPEKKLQETEQETEQEAKEVDGFNETEGPEKEEPEKIETVIEEPKEVELPKKVVKKKETPMMVYKEEKKKPKEKAPPSPDILDELSPEAKGKVFYNDKELKALRELHPEAIKEHCLMVSGFIKNINTIQETGIICHDNGTYHYVERFKGANISAIHYKSGYMKCWARTYLRYNRSKKRWEILCVAGHYIKNGRIKRC